MSNAALNAKGEIVDVTEADQFQVAKSQFECGFFGCAMARTMSKPGQPATMTAAQVIANAEKWYAQYDGSDAASNTDGMTDAQEYELLQQIGLHYQALPLDIGLVRQWVAWGYPVLLAITEASVHDIQLDGANPYPWNPSGNHIILITGITGTGHLLVRDSANCTSISNPRSLRPGPRTYVTGELQLIGATVVVPPWRPRPASATAVPTADMQIPTGWQDDQPTDTLTAPNGVAVTGDFRQFILAHAWNPGDVPMAPAYSANPVELGYQQQDGNQDGTRLVCMYSELCQTASRGVYKASVGRELYTALQRQPTSPPPAQSTGSGGGPGAAEVPAALKAEIMAAIRLISDAAAHAIAQVSRL